jgi:hypothetical protein
MPRGEQFLTYMLLVGVVSQHFEFKCLSREKVGVGGSVVVKAL